MLFLKIGIYYELRFSLKFYNVKLNFVGVVIMNIGMIRFLYYLIFVFVFYFYEIFKIIWISYN